MNSKVTKMHDQRGGAHKERIAFWMALKWEYERLWSLLVDTYLKKAIFCYISSEKGIQNQGSRLLGRSDEQEHFQPHDYRNDCAGKTRKDVVSGAGWCHWQNANPGMEKMSRTLWQEVVMSMQYLISEFTVRSGRERSCFIGIGLITPSSPSSSCFLIFNFNPF